MNKFVFLSALSLIAVSQAQAQVAAEEVRTLKEQVAMLKNDIHYMLVDYTDEIKKLKQRTENLELQVKLVTGQMQNILETLKTNKNLAKELESRERKSIKK